MLSYGAPERSERAHMFGSGSHALGSGSHLGRLNRSSGLDWDG